MNKAFEVIVRKIVTESVIVRADNKEEAKERGSCRASDGDTEQILEVVQVFELSPF